MAATVLAACVAWTCMSTKWPSRATRSSRTRSSPTSSTRSTTISCGSRSSSRCSRRRIRSRATTRSAIYNLLAFGELYERIPVHDHVLPVVEGVLDPGCLISSLSSIAILAGRDRAADPRRRPTHPVAEAAPADGVQLDVGAHRLHRGQRRDAPRPRLPPLGPLAELRPAVRLDRGRDAEGLGADLARQPVARRRREHHTTNAGSASR